jgi:hypothetical protein
MRAGKKDGRSRPVLFSTLARWTIPTLAAAVVFYFGIQDDAQSQISGSRVSAPFSTAAHTDTKPARPKAPVQVEMPAPPPIKYLAGLEEPLVATGPVTEEENKDLDIALATFHEAPLQATPGSDYSDYAKPLLAFITLHPNSNWNAALYTNIGFGYYHAGYYSRTFDAFEKAWQLGRDATTPQAPPHGGPRCG